MEIRSLTCASARPSSGRLDLPAAPIVESVIIMIRSNNRILGVQYPTIGVSIIDLSPCRKILALLGHLFLGFQKGKLEMEINVVNTPAV